VATPAAAGSRADEAPTIGGGAPPEVLFDRLRARALENDRARFASLEVASLAGVRGDTIELDVPGAFHAERLGSRLAELEQIARDLFGQTVHVAVRPSETRSSARQTTALSRELARKRRQEALNSEPVNLALEILGAEIVEIRPLGEPS
jgi:hypothetical protein